MTQAIANIRPAFRMQLVMRLVKLKTAPVSNESGVRMQSALDKVLNDPSATVEKLTMQQRHWKNAVDTTATARDCCEG